MADNGVRMGRLMMRPGPARPAVARARAASTAPEHAPRSHPGGTMVMLALDHGISMGPLPGLEDPRSALAAAAHGASCVTVHRGLVRAAAEHAASYGILLHLSASTAAAPDPDAKRLVASVEEATRLGCDGVSLHINLGSATESAQLADAGAVAAACGEWGMPLVAMVYPRGPAIAQPPATHLVAHAARLGAELGADAVKVPLCPDFRDVVQGCPVRVLAAGGARAGNFPAFLQQLREARRAGARGVSIGRNVFQHPDPARAMRAVAKVFA